MSEEPTQLGVQLKPLVRSLGGPPLSKLDGAS